MKTLLASLLFLPLALGLSIPGCEKKPAPPAPAPKPELIAPVHQKILFYINNYTLGPDQGCSSSIDFAGWTPERVHIVTDAVCGVVGQTPYTANLDYVGTRDQIDHYLIRITYPIPGGIGSYIKPFSYDGRDTEVWRDAEYRIGIRPPSEPSPSPTPTP